MLDTQIACFSLIRLKAGNVTVVRHFDHAATAWSSNGFTALRVAYALQATEIIEAR